MLLGLAVLCVAILTPGRGEPGSARLIVAALLLGGGVAVGLAAAKALGRALTPFPRPRPGTPLSRRGPYRLVRHPIYTAVILVAVGVSIVGSPWAFIPTAILAVVLDQKATREEAWLIEAHPAYVDVRAEVPWRFFPGLR